MSRLLNNLKLFTEMPRVCIICLILNRWWQYLASAAAAALPGTVTCLAVHDTSPRLLVERVGLNAIPVTSLRCGGKPSPTEELPFSDDDLASPKQPPHDASMLLLRRSTPTSSSRPPAINRGGSTIRSPPLSSPFSVD
ncbi:hypothetical protein E2C01_019226 [Portunus trituberculatus]|uniref:Uncharacterized protein n=1 Tax=Portunus trituberculatus TaxID=210409 RepID=A0A5B7DXP4_PORTR|nr:hypothetical protein [Portunus trituberculatus]